MSHFLFISMEKLLIQERQVISQWLINLLPSFLNTVYASYVAKCNLSIYKWNLWYAILRFHTPNYIWFLDQKRRTFLDINNHRKRMSFVKVWDVTFSLPFVICFCKQTTGHAISTMKNYFSAYSKNNPKIILSFYHHKVGDAVSCF